MKMIQPRGGVASLLASAFLAGALGTGIPAVAQTAPACGTARPEILVGGVSGFNSLGDPAASAKLRATCRVGLYVHAEAWKRTSDADKARILAAFAGAPPAAIEIGYVDAAAERFANYFKPQFLDEGIPANTAVVNGLCIRGGLAGATRFIDTAKQYGLDRVAIVYAPNSKKFRDDPDAFSDPEYDCVRSAALLGGAIAIDAPPHFFFTNTPEYQEFVLDEIRWANANSVASYYIVSPNKSGPQFGAEAARMIDYLRAAGAVPTNFIFEGYCLPCTDPAHETGNENDPSTVAGVAFSLLPKILR